MFKHAILIISFSLDHSDAYVIEKKTSLCNDSGVTRLRKSGTKLNLDWPTDDAYKINIYIIMLRRLKYVVQW